jgi:hypothetical protein
MPYFNFSRGRSESYEYDYEDGYFQNMHLFSLKAGEVD